MRRCWGDRWMTILRCSDKGTSSSGGGISDIGRIRASFDAKGFQGRYGGDYIW